MKMKEKIETGVILSDGCQS